MNYIITNKDQTIKSIPSGEKYLILNKVLFDYTIFKNEDTIILKVNKSSSITITPGYTTIEKFFDSFKLIDSNFEYDIVPSSNYGLYTVYYKFRTDVSMTVNGATGMVLDMIKK